MLVERHRTDVYARCYRMLGSVQDAEDALQESFLAAWRGLAGFEGRSSLHTWLYSVATNACLRLSSRRPPGCCHPSTARLEPTPVTSATGARTGLRVRLGKETTGLPVSSQSPPSAASTGTVGGVRIEPHRPPSPERFIGPPLRDDRSRVGAQPSPLD